MNMHEDATCPEAWKKSSQKRRRRITGRVFMSHTFDWYTKGENGEDLGVETYEFSEINNKWHEICDKCRYPPMRSSKIKLKEIR